MNCRHCNNEISEGAQFCGSCGAEVEITSPDSGKAQESLKRCGHCYCEIAKGVDFCPNCGESVKHDGVSHVLNEAHRKKSGKDFLLWLAMLVVFILAIAGVSLFTGGFNSQTPEDLEYATYRYDDSGVVYTITFGYKDDIIYKEHETTIVNITGWEQEWIDEWIIYYDEYAAMGKGIEEFEYKKEVSDRQLKFELIYTDLGAMNTMKKLADAGFESFEGFGQISMSGTEKNFLAAGYVLCE